MYTRFAIPLIARSPFLNPSSLSSQAMKKVDRAHYVLDKRDAYEDAPQWVSLSPSRIDHFH